MSANSEHLELEELTGSITNIKVSSVLNRNTREYGKKHLTDKKLETCWNSEQGSPQFIVFEFAEPRVVTRLDIVFQGGFVGKSVELLAMPIQMSIPTTAALTERSKKIAESVMIGTAYPEDSNSKQLLEFDNHTAYTKYKIVFPQSTDFYGRITIYSLEVFGY